MVFNTLKTLAYNILKSLEEVPQGPDSTVRDIKFLELGPCTECDNKILSLLFKVLTLLGCGHVFHRFCIKKKLLAEMDVYPFPDCKRNMDNIGENTRREMNLEEKSPETSQEDNQEMDVDGGNVDNGDVNSEIETLPLEPTQLKQSSSTPSSSKNKKRANEVTDFSSSKKSKKHVQLKERNKKACHELIIANYYFEEKLEKCLADYREVCSIKEAL